MTMNYKSPAMKIPEIVVSMKEIGFNVTEKDFRRPESKRWREIYAKIFESLTNINIGVVIQHIGYIGRIKVNHSELFEEGFSQMAFTLCMQRVLRACGYGSFSFKDLVEPNTKMLVRMASGFVNISKHNTTRGCLFNDILDELAYLKVEFDKNLNKNNEMKEQLSKLKEASADTEAEIAQCKEEEESLNAQLDELHREPLLRDIEEIKHGIAEKNALKEKLKQNIIDAQQECEKLSNKIVSSPERFKQDQDKLRNKVQNLKALKEAKGKKLMQDRSLLEQTANKRIACEKISKLVKEIQADVGMAREVHEELENFVEKVHELREQQLSFLTQKEDLEENIAVRQSQQQKILSKSGLIKQCGEQESADGFQQCEIFEKQLEKMNMGINAIKTKISETEKAMKLEKQDHAKRKADLDAEFPTFYKEMDMLHYQATSGLEDLKESMIIHRE